MDKSNNQQPISHHYVPQFYLRQFSNKRGKEYSIYTFDKILKKVFLTNIKKVCCEDYFNDLIDGIPYSYYEVLNNESKSGKKIKKIKTVRDYIELKDDEEPSYLAPPEILFQNNEDEFSKVYREILKLEDISQLSDYDRALTATFIIYQWKRTKAQRNFIKNIILNFIKKQIAMADSAENIRDLVLFYYNDIFLRYLHINNVLRTEDMLEGFLNMGWTLYINETDFPYYTSDNPIAVENITEIEQYKASQIRDGFKIYFPLSPKICLLLYDPAFYKYPTKILDIDIQSVREKNKLQVDNSMRQIFSCDNISLANEFTNNTPFIDASNLKSSN